jgi:hypothetical protein
VFQGPNFLIFQALHVRISLFLGAKKAQEPYIYTLAYRSHYNLQFHQLYYCFVHFHRYLHCFVLPQARNLNTTSLENSLTRTLELLPQKKQSFLEGVLNEMAPSNRSRVARLTRIKDELFLYLAKPPFDYLGLIKY